LDLTDPFALKGFTYNTSNIMDSFTEIALNSLSHERIELGPIHCDTTSVSLQGAYDGEILDGVVHTTYGYSKDNRPDLKQLKLGMAVNSEGIQVGGYSQGPEMRLIIILR
jgi:transposase